jgi:hypothetical protein
MSEPVKAIYNLTAAMASVGGFSSSMGGSSSSPTHTTSPSNGAMLVVNSVELSPSHAEETSKLLLDSPDSKSKNCTSPPSDKTLEKTAAELSSEEGKKDEKESTKSLTTSFPIPLALLMLIAWILLSAGLFCLWETEWGYLTSIYFFFISIRFFRLNLLYFH